MMILNAMSDDELERFADYSFDPGLSTAARTELDGRKVSGRKAEAAEATGDLL